MPVRLDVDGASIVLVGALNPAILQPAWFASLGLISVEEAQAADIAVISNDVVVFSTQLFQVQATREQLVVSTVTAPVFTMLPDLVLGAFRTLPHTPIALLGINRDAHFRMSSEEEWQAFGRRLAPPEPWEATLQDPGMRAVIMQGQRPDAYTGRIMVRVEPSLRISPGVYVQVNDHYVVAEQPSPEGCSEAMSIIAENWHSSMNLAAGIHASLFESMRS